MFIFTLVNNPEVMMTLTKMKHFTQSLKPMMEKRNKEVLIHILKYYIQVYGNIY